MSGIILLLIFLIACCLPGFLATFWIGCWLWPKKKHPKRPGLHVLSSLGGILGAFLILAWFVIFDTGSTIYSSPMTAEEAQHQGCPIALPDGAKNVRFARAGAWMSYEYLVRFEAPVEVCHAFAQHYNADEPLKPITTQPQPNTDDMVSQGSWFSNARWFDIENIVHGVTTTRSVSEVVWVDDDRAVCYYKIMN